MGDSKQETLPVPLIQVLQMSKLIEKKSTVPEGAVIIVFHQITLYLCASVRSALGDTRIVLAHKKAGEEVSLGLHQLDIYFCVLAGRHNVWVQFYFSWFPFEILAECTNS